MHHLKNIPLILKFLTNFIFIVLVLPAYDCNVSLSNQCSGGDLDGDKYGIIWDQRFIPKDVD